MQSPFFDHILNILPIIININVNLYFNSLTYLSFIYSSEIMSFQQINPQHTQKHEYLTTLTKNTQTVSHTYMKTYT